MKRKIVKHGPSSLTMSLPMKWIKKNNLKSGDEVEVEEDNDTLIIGSKVVPKVLSLEIDVSNTNNMLNRIVVATYKAGYDEVTFKYSSSEELETIQKTIDRSCHAFDIINYTKDTVSVKAISSLDEREFDSVLKRLFFTVMDIGDEIVKGIKANDLSGLKNIALMDRTIDKHSDFCRRLMNKQNIFPNSVNAIPIYVIVEQTEIMCDYYKKMCEQIHDKKIKVDKNLTDYLIEVNKIIRAMYTTFLKFNIENIKQIGEYELRIKQMRDEIIKKQKTQIDILFYITHIFEVGFEMKSALMTAFLESENKIQNKSTTKE